MTVENVELQDVPKYEPWHDQHLSILQERSPDDPPWGSGVAVLYWFIYLALMVLFPTLAIGAYLLIIGREIPAAAEFDSFLLTDVGSILVQITAIIPAHIVTVVVGWYFVTQSGKYNFFEMIGWKSDGVKWWHYPIYLFAFFSVASLIVQYFPPSETQLDQILKSSYYAVVALSIMAVFFAPFVEELVFRGVMYSAFQRSLGRWPAVAIVSLLFCAVHIPQYIKSPVTILLLLGLSVILTLLRAYSKNLWPSIVLHFLFNGIQSLGMLLAPYATKDLPEVASLNLGKLF